MEKFRKECYKGSTFITVLLFLYLFSLLFFLMIEDYQLTRNYAQRTEHFYEAKTMLSLFLTDMKKDKDLNSQGKVIYSTGSLDYQIENGSIEITVHISGFQYIFHETIN